MPSLDFRANPEESVSLRYAGRLRRRGARSSMRGFVPHYFTTDSLRSQWRGRTSRFGVSFEANLHRVSHGGGCDGVIRIEVVGAQPGDDAGLVLW